MSHRKSWMVRINPYPSGPNYRFRLYATPADRNFVHSYHPTIAEAINHARHLEALHVLRMMPSDRGGSWKPEYRIEGLTAGEWVPFTNWTRTPLDAGDADQMYAYYPASKYRAVRRYVTTPQLIDE